MITLSPIHKNVRKTLDDRSRAQKRDNFGSGLEPQSDNIKILQDTTTKSIWIKMYSSVITPNNIVGAKIYGGEVFSGTGEGANPRQGFAELYSGMSGGALDPISENTSDELIRPLAGINSISCAYESKLKATRAATINWTCWSFEDLERFTPHFMAHGKGVLLEWGYGDLGQNIETVSDQDMIDGKAYNKVNNMVIDSGGKYDGICGIIRNYEWKVRDDGGFDVTTEIVSRGVNIMNSQIDQSDAPMATSVDGSKEAEGWPTLEEFCAGLEQHLFSLATTDSSWWDFEKSLPPGNWDDENWEKGSKLPPGVLVYATDGFFQVSREAGPYVTWGFFEDNILNKWVGRFSADDFRITNQFRSIQPKNLDDFNGNTEGIDFESVQIANHPLLFTPHMDRWILPGQFPAELIPPNGNRANEEFVQSIAQLVNNEKHFQPFASNEDKSKGYLRNILISFKLINEAVSGVKTLQEALQNLFDALNSDVGGFWNFTPTTDSYLNGNMKVIDDKTVTKYPSYFIKEYTEKKLKNPDSELFIFDSWGEGSVVYSQEMSVKLPTAMAVTAMYAGSSPPNATETEGDQDSKTVGELQGGEGLDQSQPNIISPSRIGGDVADAYGTQNPYILDKTKSDAGAIVPKNFGLGHGVPFKSLDYEIILDKYLEKQKDSKTVPPKKRKVEKPKSITARQPETVINFFKVANKSKNGKKGTMEDCFYDEHGNMMEDGKSNQLYKRVMVNVLSKNKSFAKGANGEFLPGVPKKEMEDPNPVTAPLPIELSIGIDGVGGIFPGNAFNVNYIQERYKEYCVFEAIEINQDVSPDGWKTDIKGQLRVAPDLLYKRDNVTELNEVLTKAEEEGVESFSREEFVEAFKEKRQTNETDFTDRATTFNEAFALARDELGPNAAFTWNGKNFVTRLDSEGYGNTANLDSSGDYTDA
tara:strand:+ start:1568 stop:4354 length:2787 start_codon:yes stop_codon:yes gene_type:complete